jgi:hypothetical protein
MKIRVILLSLVVMFAISTVVAGAPKSAPAGDATAAFAKLKSLAGSWEGESPMGKIRERYELVSDGHVLLQHTAVEGMHDDMITTYYLDGDKLRLTHYCGLGNQPRMQAKIIDLESGQIAFEFTGAGNLASLQEKHMHSATVKLADADHYASDWTLFENGKPTTHVSAQYTRIK